jgi:hypothetical protein
VGFLGFRGDNGNGDEGLLCADPSHAALAEVGEGSWASFSDRSVVRGCVDAAGGNEEAIMSYADGERSSKDASSYKMQLECDLSYSASGFSTTNL